MTGTHDWVSHDYVVVDSLGKEHMVLKVDEADIYVHGGIRFTKQGKFVQAFAPTGWVYMADIT